MPDLFFLELRINVAREISNHTIDVFFIRDLNALYPLTDACHYGRTGIPELETKKVLNP